MNSMLVKPLTNFPRDGHPTAVIGKKQIVKMTKTKWPQHGTVQCFMIS